MDQLKETLTNQGSDTVDDADTLSILQAMYVFTLVPVGRDSLIRVLSWDLEPMCELISPTGTARPRIIAEFVHIVTRVSYTCFTCRR